MKRPLVTERYVLAEQSSNKIVQRDPEDVEPAPKKLPAPCSKLQARNQDAPPNVLPYGGLSPANYKECNVVLPTTPADHDQAGLLAECVATDENGEAVLDTGKILTCAKEEFKR